MDKKSKAQPPHAAICTHKKRTEKERNIAGIVKCLVGLVFVFVTIIITTLMVLINTMLINVIFVVLLDVVRFDIHPVHSELKLKIEKKKMKI